MRTTRKFVALFALGVLLGALFIQAVKQPATSVSLPDWARNAAASTLAPVAYGEWNPTWQTNIQGQADNSVIAARDADMHHQLDIIHWYAGAGESYSGYDHVLVDAATSINRIPFVSWGLPVGFSDTSVLDDWAKGIGSKLVYIRLFWEFNDPPTGTNANWGVCQSSRTPAQLVSSWKFIVDRFRADGASNVKWVWNPDGTMGAQMYGATCGSLASAYPGDSYVDFRGFDTYGYLNQALYNDENQQTGSSKQMLLGEANAQDSQNGSAWVNDLSTRIQATGSMNQVAGIVWFNDGRNGNYSFATNPNTKAAVQQMLQTPAFVSPPPPAAHLTCPVIANPMVGQPVTCTYG